MWWIAGLLGCGETCGGALAEACEPECPSRDALPCDTGGYYDPLRTDTCGALDVFRCTGTNVTAKLWMFDGETLVLFATQGCADEGTCRSTNGWTVFGEPTPEQEGCLSATDPDLYCYE